MRTPKTGTGWIGLAMAVAGLVLLAPVARASTWKWVDVEGQIHLTDNFPSIPDEYKPKAVEVGAEEPPGKATPSAATAAPQSPVTRPAGGAPPAATGGTGRGEKLRMTDGGGVEAVPDQAATVGPSSRAAPGEKKGEEELEKDGCGYTQRHWTLRVVPAHQDLERAEADLKRIEGELSKRGGMLVVQRSKLLNDKRWAEQKITDAKKMIEKTIPQDAKKCETPEPWLKPPTR